MSASHKYLLIIYCVPGSMACPEETPGNQLNGELTPQCKSRDTDNRQVNNT